MDLLTVLAHELGHVIGREHSDAHDVMQSQLEPGEERFEVRGERLGSSGQQSAISDQRSAISVQRRHRLGCCLTADS